MSYLIDTDWVVEYLRGREPARQLLAALGQSGFAISLITYGEIYEGIQFGQDRHRHEQGFRQFLRVATILPLNRRIIQLFAQMRGELRRSGQLIGDLDLLIAATSRHHKLTLVTRNVAHFQRIPGLTLYKSSA